MERCIYQLISYLAKKSIDQCIPEDNDLLASNLYNYSDQYEVVMVNELDSLNG